MSGERENKQTLDEGERWQPAGEKFIYLNHQGAVHQWVERHELHDLNYEPVINTERGKVEKRYVQSWPGPSGAALPRKPKNFVPCPLPCPS